MFYFKQLILSVICLLSVISASQADPSDFNESDVDDYCVTTESGTLYYMKEGILYKIVDATPQRINDELTHVDARNIKLICFGDKVFVEYMQPDISLEHTVRELITNPQHKYHNQLLFADLLYAPDSEYHELINAKEIFSGPSQKYIDIIPYNDVGVSDAINRFDFILRMKSIYDGQIKTEYNFNRYDSNFFCENVENDQKFRECITSLELPDQISYEVKGETKAVHIFSLSKGRFVFDAEQILDKSSHMLPLTTEFILDFIANETNRDFTQFIYYRGWKTMVAYINKSGNEECLKLINVTSMVDTAVACQQHGIEKYSLRVLNWDSENPDPEKVQACTLDKMKTLSCAKIIP